MILSHIVPGIGGYFASPSVASAAVDGPEHVRRPARAEQYGAIIYKKSPAATFYAGLLSRFTMIYKGVLPDLCLTFLHHDEPAFLLQLTPSTKCHGNNRLYTPVAAGIFIDPLYSFIIPTQKRFLFRC